MAASNPFCKRDIVRVVRASVDRTLYDFFFDNSHLSAIAIAATTATNTPTHAIPPPTRKKAKSNGLPRPGVILDTTDDHATIAMFTTLQGKGLTAVKGLLRPVIASIHPLNQKPSPPPPSGWPPAFSIYPTWRTPENAKDSLCLCLKYNVAIGQLKLWGWGDEPEVVGGKYVMCRDDFRVLQDLCERNEGLRGLFASESWLFEQLNLDDFVKRLNG